MQCPYWDGLCLVLERSEFQLLQVPVRCAAVSCFSVTLGGRHQTKRQVQPCESMLMLGVEARRQQCISPSVQDHKSTRVWMFCCCSPEQAPTQWNSISAPRLSFVECCEEKRGPHDVGSVSFAVGLLVHGCWVCAPWCLPDGL